jgi:hypothetical protein
VWFHRELAHPSRAEEITQSPEERIDSLTDTSKLHGLDPKTYLHIVLSRIADPPVEHIEQLLPWPAFRGSE